MYWPNDHNEDYFAISRDENWKLIYRFATDRFELYDLDADPAEASDVAASNRDRVMRMARRMAQEFDGGWGTLGPLWPTFAGASRPYTDDPFAMPSLPSVDIDQDGIADNEEDSNNNGLVDAGETDPDNQDSDRDNTLDGDEVRTGTDPLDPSSFFGADILSRSATEIQMSWPSAPGAFYRIESSTTLSRDGAPNWITYRQRTREVLQVEHWLSARKHPAGFSGLCCCRSNPDQRLLILRSL